MIDTFRRVAPHALAFSFIAEVFKQMPNDTDFSVSIGAGKPGLDFATAGERNHYHTNRDTIANLNPASLQHHGDNVLAARARTRRPGSFQRPADLCL